MMTQSTEAEGHARKAGRQSQSCKMRGFMFVEKTGRPSP